MRFYGSVRRWVLHTLNAFRASHVDGDFSIQWTASIRAERQLGPLSIDHRTLLGPFWDWNRLLLPHRSQPYSSHRTFRYNSDTASPESRWSGLSPKDVPSSLFTLFLWRTRTSLVTYFRLRRVDVSPI